MFVQGRFVRRRIACWRSGRGRWRRRWRLRQIGFRFERIRKQIDMWWISGQGTARRQRWLLILRQVSLKLWIAHAKAMLTMFAAAATAAAICCFWASARIWTIFCCVAGSVCFVLIAGYGLSFEPDEEWAFDRSSSSNMLLTIVHTFARTDTLQC